MTVVDELAAFLIAYAQDRAELSHAAWGALYGEGSVMQRGAVEHHLTTAQAVATVLKSDVLPTQAEKHAVLYLIAKSTRAVYDPGFNQAWRPAGATDDA